MSDPRLELGDTDDPNWIPLAGELGGFFPVGELPFCLWRLSDAPDETIKEFLRKLGGASPKVKSLDSWVALIDSLPDDPVHEEERFKDPEVVAVHVTVRTFRCAAEDTPFRQAHLDRRRINQIICDHYDAVRAIVLANRWKCVEGALESPAILECQARLIEPLRELAEIRPPGLPSTFWQRLRSAWSDLG